MGRLWCLKPPHPFTICQSSYAQSSRLSLTLPIHIHLPHINLENRLENERVAVILELHNARESRIAS